jgi:hypothetical protein
VIRLVSEIHSLRVRDGDEFGLVLHGGAHEAEIWVRPPVECAGLAIKDCLMGECVEVLGPSHG